MTTSDRIRTLKQIVGSKVFYRGIPSQKATIKAIHEGKAYLKYRGEKGCLVVPFSHCSIL